MWTPARPLAAACALLTLTGCAAGTPTSPAPASVESPTPASGTLTGTKAAAGAKLPGDVDGWTLTRSSAGVGGAKLGFYAKAGDAKAQVIATLSPVALTPDALAKVLSSPATFGPATCGNVAGGTTVACYVPLSGGNLSVTGPLAADELGALTQHLYAALP